MSMNLNIGFNKDEKFVSSSLPLLKAWGIYEVTFDGCEYTTFAGKKDPNANYEVLKFKFKGETGQYVETLFAPKPGDEERKTRTNANGHEVPTPSNIDNFKYELGQLLTYISPEALNKLAGKSVSFSDIAKFVVKQTEASIGKTVYIKLIGNKSNKPRFPYFLSFFEGQGEPVITNNFISDSINKLGFTEYELSQKDKIENAKPTNMASVSEGNSTDLNNPDASDESASADLDLDLL